MHILLLISIFVSFKLFAFQFFDFEESFKSFKIISSTKRIELKNYPNAHNPSIIKFQDGFLLVSRFIPFQSDSLYISYIGVVLLNDSFDVISEPQLLNTRIGNCKTPSQAEDARVFSYRGRLFLIYNDNVDVTEPSLSDRRDMFIAELHHDGKHFSLSLPLKLIHNEKYHAVLWQKNWIPFEWNKTLLLSYSFNPQEILYPNLFDGICYNFYETSFDFNWSLGRLKGSTPPQLFDGEYLGFFHSGTKGFSSVSLGFEMWHYFMGAYTFSASPPFNVTKVTPYPIVGDDFYTPSFREKRVIFPGGFVLNESSIFVAYGKDDCEMWIATIDRKALKEVLIPIDDKRIKND